MTRAHGITWTGLHVPQDRSPKPSTRRASNAIAAPCEGCSAGPLTCSAYIRFQLRGSSEMRDVDAESALAELMPLLDCDPRGAKAIRTIILAIALGTGYLAALVIYVLCSVLGTIDELRGRK